EWMASEAPRWFSLESEGILRLTYAYLGTRDDLIATLEGMRRDAEEMLRVGKAIGEEYLAGTGTYQDQWHIRAPVFAFLAQFGLDVIDWADRSLREVEGWDDLSPDGKEERALQLI